MNDIAVTTTTEAIIQTAASAATGGNAPQPSDMLGWIAAIGGMLAFGTFGVPIKSKTAKRLNIDPLVFQSYKTGMCFLTSWLILLYGEEFSFTPWGIVSGIFWVPGGVATIYAVKTAGLAIGIGVGSSFIVLVSFTWGIFIFDEHVHSKAGATLAVSCMMMGLLGMAYYSAPSQNRAVDGDGDGVIASSSGTDTNDATNRRQQEYSEIGSTINNDDDDEDLERDAAVQDPLTTESSAAGNATAPSSDNIKTNGNDTKSQAKAQTRNAAAAASDGADEDVGLVEMSDEMEGTNSNDDDDVNDEESKFVNLCGIKIPLYFTGVAAAAFTGIWGGSIMVPMQWSPPSEKGSHYLISFAIGATTVNISLWIIRYIYLCFYYESPVAAYYALPSFHIRKMWLPGGTCGLLWSIGNFCSILSVEYLGEGVGYSVVQASMLVSGLWGIFFFHEIRGVATVTKWFLSASVTVFGILFLSYEHHEK